MSNEKLEIVPELRFPEFSGEWKKTKLGEKEISDFIKDRVALNQLDVKTYISTENLLPNYSGIKIATKLPPLGSFVQFKKKDILISNIRPYLKKVWQATINGNSSNDVIVIRAKTKVIDSFLVCILKNDNFIDYVMRNAKGTKMPRGDLSSIKKYSLFYPKKREQQKIADCLTSLDELITLKTQKIESLKTHKKGLLQQLFPAEGKTSPSLRFPEFGDDGDWEEERVDDFFDVGSSKRVLQKDWTNEGIPFYRTRELVSLSKNEPFGSEIFISEELFLELSKKYGAPKTGDFLISGVGTLGISYQVKNNDKFYFKDGNVIWFKLGDGIVSDYFKYSFQTKFIQKQIFGKSSASTVGTYTISNARETKFWKPFRKEEQQKIADCLSSLDKLITLQTQKINHLKTHKKGLLQQMFV